MDHDPIEQQKRVDERNREFVAMLEEHCAEGGFLFGDMTPRA
ncbi:MAG: hypothetical protein V7638_3842 [Acidobacteriota bacterium]|jgi:hypothetical protein